MPFNMQTIHGWFADRFGFQSKSGGVLLWLLRGCFGAIIIGMGLFAFDYFRVVDPESGIQSTTNGVIAFIVVLCTGALVVATDLLVRNKQITTISAVYFGLLLGLLLGTLFP